MKNKVFIAAASGLLVAALATQPNAAGHSPTEKREAIMSDVGKSTKTIGDMLKGTTDFDAAAANAALVSMREGVEGFVDLYPEGTEGETTNKYLAAPAVWTDRAGFEAESAKFEAALDTAIAANVQDKEALAAVFGAVGQSCRSCHEGYRVQK
ncbi:MAG: cytochrome c [Roseobacter sp.]